VTEKDLVTLVAWKMTLSHQNDETEKKNGDKYVLRIYHKRDFQETTGNIHCGIHRVENF